jgi:alpha-tubulin suppressor-like RCC1 family protein
VVEVLRGQVVEDISCGAAHSVAVVCMSLHALHHSTVTETSSVSNYTWLIIIIDVAKFETHQVYSWGCNSFGQLGQGKKKRVLKPFPVAELSKVKPLEVMCGSLHTLIRTEEGDVWSSGCNKSGQLGHGHTM